MPSVSSYGLVDLPGLCLPQLNEVIVSVVVVALLPPNSRTMMVMMFMIMADRGGPTALWL